MIRKQQKKRIATITEALKSVLLGLLLVSLVVQVVIYIHGMRVYEKVVVGEDGAESFNKLWSTQGGSEPQGLDASGLIPEFIGYKQASFITPRGCVGNTGAVTALYDLVKPCLLELFGSGSVCSVLDSEYGKALFDSAQSGEEFIYIRYHVPVMYQMIYAYAAQKLTVEEDEVASGINGAVGAYVSELIIVSDKSKGAGTTVAYANDSKGGYYEFRPTGYAAESSFYFSKLANNDSGVTATDFSFVRSDSLVGAEPMIDSELLCADVTSSVTDLSNDEIRDGLFRLLGYNPDKLDVYDDKGADVYIDSHSRLRLGGGSVSFVTTDASAGAYDELRGISVDTLLGYSLDEAPSLLDKLTASNNFIRLLGEVSYDLIGGEASLCLGDVYRDGELLVIEYIPVYNNIRIGSEVQLRVVFADSTICEFELFPVSVVVSETDTLVPSPRFILERLEADEALTEKRTAEDMRLRYNSGSAEWNAVLSAD